VSNSEYHKRGASQIPQASSSSLPKWKRIPEQVKSKANRHKQLLISKYATAGVTVHPFIVRVRNRKERERKKKPNAEVGERQGA
jgi:hypothetical protein